MRLPGIIGFLLAIIVIACIFGGCMTITVQHDCKVMPQGCPK